jgi:hypothetical protein
MIANVAHRVHDGVDIKHARVASVPSKSPVLLLDVAIGLTEATAEPGMRQCRRALQPLSPRPAALEVGNQCLLVRERKRWSPCPDVRDKLTKSDDLHRQQHADYANRQLLAESARQDAIYTRRPRFGVHCYLSVMSGSEDSWRNELRGTFRKSDVLNGAFGTWRCP